MRAFSLSLIFVFSAFFASCDSNTPTSGSNAMASNQKSSTKSSVESGEVLAMVKGSPITFKDLEKGLSGRPKGTFIKAQSEFFQAKKQALDDFLYDHLLERYAKDKGVSVTDANTKQVTQKIKKVRDRDVEKFYNDFKKDAEKQGRRLPPLEQVSDRIRNKLKQDRMTERRTAFFDELKRRYKVQYHLTPPRVDVAFGTNPPKGSKKAPVTIVEFSDFECPYCKRGAETLQKVLKEYGRKVKVYYRDFPLGFHKKAVPAAVAARCAGEQGKFWQYHDKLFETRKLGQDELLTHAKAMKLNMKKFEPCLKENKYKKKVDEDMQAGTNVGVSGTPAFFVNGIPLSGAVPFENFKEIIDEELKRIKQKSRKVALP